MAVINHQGIKIIEFRQVSSPATILLSYIHHMQILIESLVFFGADNVFCSFNLLNPGEAPTFDQNHCLNSRTAVAYAHDE